MGLSTSSSSSLLLPWGRGGGGGWKWREGGNGVGPRWDFGETCEGRGGRKRPLALSPPSFLLWPPEVPLLLALQLSAKNCSGGVASLPSSFFDVDVRFSGSLYKIAAWRGRDDGGGWGKRPGQAASI